MSGSSRRAGTAGEVYKERASTRDWRQWAEMDMYDQIGPAGLGSRERIFGNVATGQWMDKQANGPRV